MTKSFSLLAAVLVASAAVSCASAEKMAQMANNVQVTCDPVVLESIAGDIDAALTVTYPEGYFHPKAILSVTPVLVYEGGEVEMRPFMYQGEKVKDNYKTISSAGQTVRESREDANKCVLPAHNTPGPDIFEPKSRYRIHLQAYRPARFLWSLCFWTRNGRKHCLLRGGPYHIALE